MADQKISQLTAATTPLAGTEVLPIVQSGTTKQVSVDNLTKGRTVNGASFDTDVAAAGVTLSGTTLAADGTDTDITVNITPKGAGRTNSNGISRVTVGEGVMQELYSTSTTIFTGSQIAATNIYGSDGGTAVVAYQDFRANGNHSTGSRSTRLYLGLANSGQQTATDKFFLEDDGGPRPVSDNTVSNGAAGNRWSEIYAGTAIINTSDAREKTAVRALTDSEIAAAKELSKEIGAFKFLSAIEQKGDAARTHIGMTVQRAIEIMTAHGLDPMAYGFICFDKWDASTHRAATDAKDAVVDEDGNVVTPAVEAQDAIVQPGGERYGFRADQLLLFIARGFEARLAALEAK